MGCFILRVMNTSRFFNLQHFWNELRIMKTTIKSRVCSSTLSRKLTFWFIGFAYTRNGKRKKSIPYIICILHLFADYPPPPPPPPPHTHTSSKDMGKRSVTGINKNSRYIHKKTVWRRCQMINTLLSCTQLPIRWRFEINLKVRKTNKTLDIQTSNIF